jgi:hypothetical protein
MLASRSTVLAAVAGRSSGMPSASITSALPARLDTARLPCLATGTPQLAATIAAAVDRFKEP